jgi:hypothetical protein
MHLLVSCRKLRTLLVSRRQFREASADQPRTMDPFHKMNAMNATKTGM